MGGNQNSTKVIIIFSLLVIFVTGSSNPNLQDCRGYIYRPAVRLMRANLKHQQFLIEELG